MKAEWERLWGRDDDEFTFNDILEGSLSSLSREESILFSGWVSRVFKSTESVTRLVSHPSDFQMWNFR